MASVTERADRIWAIPDQAVRDQQFADLVAQTLREYSRLSAEYIMACNEAGTYYRVTARYGKAIDSFQEALAVMEDTVGRNESYATCLGNLAETYRLEGDLDRAARCLHEAEPLFADQTSVAFAACLNYEGHLAESRNDPSAARDCYERSLAIIEQREPNSIDLATAYQNVANAHQGTNDLVGAAAYVERALALYEDGGLRENAHYVSLLNQLGTLKTMTGDYVEAVSAYDKAIDVLDRTNVSPLDALVVYANAGGCYYAQGLAEKLAGVVGRIERTASLDELKDHPLAKRIAELAADWKRA